MSSLLSLKDTIGDLVRFRFIASTLFEEGFAFALGKLNLTWAVTLECRIRCFLKMCTGHWVRQPSSDELPIKLRLTLIKLGPTFVKLGQVLSLRPDILPKNFTDELAKLTNQVPAVPWEEAKAVIEKDLGKPVETIFKNIDQTPLAAASLAQVYRAALPDGTKVAVKVQRPNIAKLIQKDIHILAFFARLAEAKVPEWKIYRPSQVVREFADTIARELDFTIEAVHAKRFAAMFEGDPSVKVAKIFSDYSSKKVLTMELIEGVRLDDDKALAKASIDKKTLAQNGVDALLKQVFVEGFFHADPHPGNYFALLGSVFAFIDYGMVGRLLEKDRLELASFFISFLNRDSEAAIGHLLHLVDTRAATNLPSFEHDVDDILHEWYGAKLKEVRLADTFYRIIESGRKNQVYFPSSFAYLGKALLTTEAMGQGLDPEFDFVKELGPFVQKIIKAEFSPAKLKRRVVDQSLDWAYYAKTFPEKTAQILEKLGEGEIGVKINREELLELEKRIGSEGQKKLLTTVIIIVIIAVGASYLVRYGLLNLHFSVSNVGLVFLVAVLIWFLIKR